VIKQFIFGERGGNVVTFLLILAVSAIFGMMILDGIRGPVANGVGGMANVLQP